jgi:hypothetical protein
LPEAVARLVSAATVADTLAAELALEPALLLVPLLVEFEADPAAWADAALDALTRLERAAAWLLPIPPIDIMNSPIPRDRSTRVYRLGYKELEPFFCSFALKSCRRRY